MAASQLAKARPWSPNNEIRHRDVLEVKGGVTLYPGTYVCWNGGYIAPFTATTGLVPVGRYMGNKTIDNSAGSSGDLTAEIDYMDPVHLVWFDNVDTNTCIKANRGAAAYMESDHEVGNTAGSLSANGKIWAIGSSADGTAGLVGVAINR